MKTSDFIEHSGAGWAVKHPPEESHEIIRQALEGGDAGQYADIPLSRIEQFIVFADAQLHAAPTRG